MDDIYRIEDIQTGEGWKRGERGGGVSGEMGEYWDRVNDGKEKEEGKVVEADSLRIRKPFQ